MWTVSVYWAAYMNCGRLNNKPLAKPQHRWYVPTDNQWKSINIRWPMATSWNDKVICCVLLSKNPCKYFIMCVCKCRGIFLQNYAYAESRRPFDCVTCYIYMRTEAYRSSMLIIVYYGLTRIVAYNVQSAIQNHINNIIIFAFANKFYNYTCITWCIYILEYMPCMFRVV